VLVSPSACTKLSQIHTSDRCEQGMAGRNAHSSSSIPPQAVAASKQGKGLRNDLVKMVYGYGDEKQPMQESVDLLDDLVKEYLEEMCRQVRRLGGLSCERDGDNKREVFRPRRSGFDVDP